MTTSKLLSPPCIHRVSALAGLFSATQTEAVQALARAGLRNQIRVNVAVEPVASSSGREHGQGQPAPGGLGSPTERRKGAMQDQKTPSGLQASYLVCQSDQKLAQLLHFLKVRLCGPISSSGFRSPNLWPYCYI